MYIDSETVTNVKFSSKNQSLAICTYSLKRVLEIIILVAIYNRLKPSKTRVRGFSARTAVRHVSVDNFSIINFTPTLLTNYKRI